jgi:hypothetical protein
VSECAAQPCWDSVIAPLARQVPVVVGETGDSAAGPETYLPAFLPWASSHGLNVLAWTWNAWSNPDDVLVTDMQAGTPTAGEGVLYKAALAGMPLPNPSPSGTPTPTGQPSPTPTPSPSGAPPPGSPSSSQAVFQDDFESDAPNSSPAGWTNARVNSTWTVQRDGGNQVLDHSGWAGYLSAGSANWTQYLLSASIAPSGWASERDGLVFAIGESGHYSLDIVGGNQLVLTKTVGSTVTTLAQAPYAFAASRWYSLAVAFSQGSITAFVNGAPVLMSSDSSLSGGAIGLEADDPVAFDNVVVTAVGSSTPTAPPAQR